MRLKKFLSAQASTENRAPSPNHLSPHSASYAAPSPRPQSHHAGDSLGGGAYQPGPSNATLAFPEPQLYRTTSYQTGLNSQQQQHHSSFSDDARFRQQQGLGMNRNESVFSLDSSFSQDIEDNFDAPQSVLQHEIAAKELQEDGIRLFQEGRLPPDLEQWHKLIPPEAVDVLGKAEVQRQSILFEIIQGERDYVRDLELVQEIFIEPLLNFQPPVIAPHKLQGFVQKVFHNIPEICGYHQTMLAALFGRQRDQHPILQGVADIVLDTALKFQSAYEPYVKQYPIAEAAHRTEMQRNSKYADFISRASDDPRTKRRDLITFLSRPVTRLPRLNLLLETLRKHMDNQAEKDAIDLVVGTTGEFLKSLQPGIEVANRKVEFFALVEQLTFRRGEIIDMDLYSDQRSLIFSGNLARRRRAELELGKGWVDMHVTLLDNYFIQTKLDERGAHKRQMVVSRPIPLEYLRLGDSYPTPEVRGERLTDLIRDSQAMKLYAFTVYHAAAPIGQRYNLYATSEAQRDEWVAKIKEAQAIREVQVDANRWFASNTINHGVFAARTPVTLARERQFTGLITSAAPFTSNGRAMLLVACPVGVFVGLRTDSSSFRQVLGTSNIAAIAAAEGYNKAFVLADGSLYAYSLELLVRVATGHAPRQALNASLEKLSPKSGTVQFFRLGFAFDKCIVAYCVKTLLNTYVNCMEVVPPNEPINPLRPKPKPSPTPSFRELGSTLYVPRDAYDITFLSKSLAIANERGITIVNPLNPGSVLTVPDFAVPKNDKTPPAYLNAVIELRPKCEPARALGIVPVGDSDLLIIYTEFGVWITKHGFPSHNARFVRWEITANAYTHRGQHILLFSCLPSPQGGTVPGEWIEVRHVPTGQLRQVITARDARLVQNGTRTTQGPVLVAMRNPSSTNERENGSQDVLAELIETVPISHRPSPSSSQPHPDDLRHLWSEFGI
ncbi:hypothetical protein EXIGLDRAFT_670103 [Exidia glandulosa HHB12029]|uniref:Dbl homology domain-containing protein n=1 Tax=Exidia glandulosa HHB12029 TaxID=1314781 RepID=A0A165L644_EXIGL|nr:hypothetical protein EXIGLDRAFT_670103 [Exidia glandulosa HHB12029]